MANNESTFEKAIIGAASHQIPDRLSMFQKTGISNQCTGTKAEEIMLMIILSMINAPKRRQKPANSRAKGLFKWIIIGTHSCQTWLWVLYI